MLPRIARLLGDIDESLPLVRGILIASLFTLAIGCSSGPKPVRPPKVNAGEAAKAAMQDFDANSDGSLDEQELAASPGLLDGLSTYDKNNDGAIDAAEIKQRLQSLYGDGVGILTLGCRVIARGGPVPDCTVKLIPESFLGDAVKPASGKTRDSGTAMLRIDPADLPPGLENVRGVQSGVYRVELEHPSSTISKLIEKSGPFGFDVSTADQVTGLKIELGR